MFYKFDYDTIPLRKVVETIEKARNKFSDYVNQKANNIYNFKQINSEEEANKVSDKFNELKEMDTKYPQLS